jgi:hypothetical protein
LPQRAARPDQRSKTLSHGSHQKICHGQFAACEAGTRRVPGSGAHPRLARRPERLPAFLLAALGCNAREINAWHPNLLEIPLVALQIE